VLICSNCRAEYREGFTTCSDCDVPLVRKLPIEPEIVPEPGDPAGDPFCSFWKGDDQRLHAELCFLLDEAKIPHKTARRQDHLFNLSNYPAFQIGVPFSLYEAAENAVRDAFDLDPADPDAVQNLVAPPLLPKNGDKLRKLPQALSPPAEEDIPGPPSAAEEESFPDDKTVEVWSGTDPSNREMFVASLNENEISSRWRDRDGLYSLHVAPQDAQRAREIVREIVEGTPQE
jgi:hypothetical protein